MKYFVRLLGVLLMMINTSCHKHNTMVVLETEAGFIGIELYKDQAPVTAYNFLNYVEKDKLDGGDFYRVVNLQNQPENEYKIEVIQGGIGWSDTITRFKPILHESTNNTKILHKTGTISMARNEPGSASSEFFICLSDQPELDFGGRRNSDGQGFAAFGKVVEGMDVVKKIHQMSDTNQFLVSPVKILSAKIIE